MHPFLLQKTGLHLTRQTVQPPSAPQLMTKSMAMPYRLQQPQTIHGTKAYLGQRLQGAEKAVYTLSFDMKALTDGAQVRFFIRDAKTDNLFIMREGFDLSDESTKNQSAAAYSRVIKKAGRWSKVSASFDFSKTVNAFASIKGVEDKGGTVTEAPVSDATLGDFVIVIQLQTKDSKALIDNVSLTKK